MTRTITLAAALSLSAGAAHAQELRYANWAAPMHTITASQIDPMAEALSAGTGGAVTLRAYHGGELGAGPQDQFVRVVQGTADLGWGLPGYTSSQFPLTMMLEAPGALPLDEPVHAAFRRAADAVGGEFPMTEVLSFWGSEPNILMMRDREIRAPGDLAGLKIRVAGAIAADAVAALGATPVQIPMTQVYNGLQTGLIDGLVSGGSVLQDFRLDEVVGSITTGPNFGRLTFFTVMNKAAHDRLPQDAQAVLEEGRADWSAAAEAAWIATADRGLDAARQSDDVTVHDLQGEDAAAFDAAMAEVTEAYVARVGGAEVLARMRGE